MNAASTRVCWALVALPSVIIATAIFLICAVFLLGPVISVLDSAQRGTFGKFVHLALSDRATPDAGGIERIPTEVSPYCRTDSELQCGSLVLPLVEITLKVDWSGPDGVPLKPALLNAFDCHGLPPTASRSIDTIHIDEIEKSLVFASDSSMSAIASAAAAFVETSTCPPLTADDPTSWYLANATYLGDIFIKSRFGNVIRHMARRNSLVLPTEQLWNAILSDTTRGLGVALLCQPPPLSLAGLALYSSLQLAQVRAWFKRNGRNFTPISPPSSALRKESYGGLVPCSGLVRLPPPTSVILGATPVQPMVKSFGNTTP